ncbi:MAG: double-strand break repair protein AddB [Pseudomonadota bacterium]
MRPSLSVYTIHPSAPFLETLARALRDNLFGFVGEFGVSLETADLTVLLPTRRACRAFREVLLDQAEGRSLFLPNIRPIGDVDEDDLQLTAITAFDDLNIPEAPASLARDLALVQLIMRWRKAQSASHADRYPIPNTSADALYLARALGRLLDLIESENGNLSALRTLVPEEFAAHYGLTLSFLDIITEWWPAWLTERGQIGSAERRNRLIDAQRLAIEAGHSTGPILAAGSTGSVPASARLLKAIAKADCGAIVLPGLDLAMRDETVERLVDEAETTSHPQSGMINIVRAIGLDLDEVTAIGVPDAGSAKARTAIINLAMAPVAETVSWPELASTFDAQTASTAFSRVTLLETPSENDEAMAVAIALRETVETPGKTAALVTPNRALATRVASYLKRWSIDIDDSAGQPLHQTRIGRLVQNVLELANATRPSVPLLACLKHPMVGLGLPKSQCRARARLLELRILRGRRIGPGLDAVSKAIEVAALDDDLASACLDILDRLRKALGPLIRLFSAGSAVSDGIANALWEAILALTEDEDGGHPDLNDPAVEALSTLLQGLTEPSTTRLDVPSREIASFVRALMAAVPVRSKRTPDTRLHIFGLLEARLQPMDRLILGSMNEGDWPDIPTTDPWLSRPMRAEVGLSAPERRIGLMAHDFVQAANAPDVIITRSLKSEGSPTVRSRFVQRVMAVLEVVGCKDGLTPNAETDYSAWANALDAAAFQPISEPMPCPALHLRPRELSVTAIERWVRDPYSIFAERVLRLKPLDPLDPVPGAADRGTFIHDALAQFMSIGKSGDKAADLDRLLTMGAEVFSLLMAEPDVYAIWWPRFIRIAEWFLDREYQSVFESATSLVEIDGAITLQGPTGPFTLKARADRIDRSKNGIEILDYKTGGVPTIDQVKTGLSPQLPLEGAIALGGGFDGVDPKNLSINGLTYLRLSGGTPPGVVTTVASDATDLCEETLDGLRDLIAAYDNPQQPYRVMTRVKWRSRYNDFSHLSRIAEWSSHDGGAREG